jgi:hypothetical protein
MIIKTSELQGPALDYAVAIAEGANFAFLIKPWYIVPFSSDWAQGGPIIESENISVTLENGEPWAAWNNSDIRDNAEYFGYGDAPLIAAMRCYVASKLGEEVEVPDELA